MSGLCSLLGDMDKIQTRKHFLRLRNSLPEEQIISMSREITKKVTEILGSYSSLAVFLNYGSEVITRDIVGYAFDKKMTVAVPKVIDRENMVFIKISENEKFIKDRHGIEEPVFDKDRILKTDKDTLIIVPGLVFGLDMHRIGYGGGYYDRFLSRNEYSKAVGVCFDFQLIDSLEKESTDMDLDGVITDRRVVL